MHGLEVGVLDMGFRVDAVGFRVNPARRGGLVFKAHRLSCYSTLGLSVIKQQKDPARLPGGQASADPPGVERGHEKGS